MVIIMISLDEKKWDEEEANIGDLAANLMINEKQEITEKKFYEPVTEQWRTTCKIKFDEPKLPDNEPPRLDIKPFHVFGYR